MQQMKLCTSDIPTNAIAGQCMDIAVADFMHSHMLSFFFGWWLPRKKRRDSVGMQNIPLSRLLKCWEGLPVWCCQRFLGLAQQRGIGSR
jgi:hypothetical protein